jgi:hypothetical protein
MAVPAERGFQLHPFRQQLGHRQALGTATAVRSVAKWSGGAVAIQCKQQLQPAPTWMGVCRRRQARQVESVGRAIAIIVSMMYECAMVSDGVQWCAMVCNSVTVPNVPLLEPSSVMILSPSKWQPWRRQHLARAFLPLTLSCGSCACGLTLILSPVINRQRAAFFLRKHDW